MPASRRLAVLTACVLTTLLAAVLVAVAVGPAEDGSSPRGLTRPSPSAGEASEGDGDSARAIVTRPTASDASSPAASSARAVGAPVNSAPPGATREGEAGAAQLAPEPWAEELGLLLAPGNGVAGVLPPLRSPLFIGSPAANRAPGPTSPAGSGSEIDVDVGVGAGSTPAATGDSVASQGVRVLDAISGAPVAGATVLVSAYHGDDETLRDAGTPSLWLVSGLTDAEGRLAVPLPWPEDPRLRLFVQVTHDSCAPRVFALAGREGASGRFRRIIQLADATDAVVLDRSNREGRRVDEAVVHLRAVESRRVRLTENDGRAVLPHVPLRVTPRRSASSFLDRAGEEALDRRLVRPGESHVLFTDEGGSIGLPFSDWVWFLELLDPLSHFKISPPAGTNVPRRVVGFVLPVLGEVALPVDRKIRDDRVLVDRDGLALPSTEIEVTIGPHRVRTITDLAGRFSVDLLPSPPSEPPVSIQHPYEGSVRILSPERLDWTVETVFPSVDPRITILGEPSPLWVIRAMTASEPTPDLVAVAPQRVVASLDGVLVHAGADGRLAFRGELPAGRDAFEIVVDDHLPAIVSAPVERKGARWLDLGDVLLSHGWSRRLEIVGVSGDALRSASVYLREESTLAPGLHSASYRFDLPSNGGLDLPFLYRGTWLVDVEGPLLAPTAGRFEAFEESLDEPVVLDARAVLLEDVEVVGRVNLGIELASSCRVIEQYWIEGQSFPLTLPEYTLDASGVFGSRRQLERVRAVRVSIIARGQKAATKLIRRGDDARFQFGEMAIRQPPSAEFIFVATGVGEVDPPLNVALEEQAVRDPRFFLGAADAVRWRLAKGRLRADNLASGRYALKIGREGDQESHLFEVPNENGGTIEVRVERPPGFQELVRVAVVDLAGNPVDVGGDSSGRLASAVASVATAGGSVAAGASGGSPLVDSTTSSLEAPPPPGSDEPGLLADALLDLRPDARDVPAEPRNLIRVRVASGQITRHRLQVPGFLSARLEVPAGAAVPTELELARPQRARALMLDSAGEPAFGEVEVSWRSLDETFVSHGEPQRFLVRRGRLDAHGLPPFPARFVFRLSGSVVASTLELTLGETRETQDLGTIRLEEKRTLRGIAYLADGRPAARAQVAFLPRERAWRYPLVDAIDWSTLAHRTRCEADGSFHFETLPDVIDESLALVVRRDGYSDAVEWPIDLAVESREFVLEVASQLRLEVGYRRPDRFDDWVFQLEYQEDESSIETRRVLGEISPDLFGARVFEGVRTGRYRVTWRLRDAYEPLPALEESVFVPTAGIGALRLVLEGELVSGRARLNGELLEKGWVLLTYDPGEQGGTRVGRVRNGSFTLMDPPDGLRAFVAVIPEGQPQAAQVIPRGEAVPVLYDGDYRSARRRGFLEISYRGRDVRIDIASEILSQYPGVRLHHDGYEWNGRQFEVEPRSEPVESLNVWFQLLSPQVHTFTLRTVRGTLLRRFTADLREEDQEIRVR